MNHTLAWTHASNPSDIVGYVASALVLAAFSVRSMRTLRMTAIAGNLAFIAYAAIGNMLPILILHGILLPMNIVRLTQIDCDRPYMNRGVLRRIWRS
jgi:hypothetical protein